MTGQKISLDDEERDALAELIADAISDGDSRESILADLSNNGISKDEAEDLVSLVELQLIHNDNAARRQMTHDSEDGGGVGWLIWVVVIVGFKILSAFF